MTSVYLAILRGACSWPAAALPPVTTFLILSRSEVISAVDACVSAVKEKCASFKNESCARHPRRLTKRIPPVANANGLGSPAPHLLNSVQELLAFAETCSIPKMLTLCLCSTPKILPRKFRQVVPSCLVPLCFLLPWMISHIVFFLLV